jgi:hypothetical protein
MEEDIPMTQRTCSLVDTSRDCDALGIRDTDHRVTCFDDEFVVDEDVGMRVLVV